VNCWIDRTIVLNDTWGPGAYDVLRAPLACAPEFSLRACYLRDGKGGRTLGQFRAEVASGFLSDGWHGAIFTPIGSVQVAGIAGLPPWDSSQADTYRNIIEGADTNLGDSRTMRLEAAIPYVDANGNVGYDTVRLFYAFNAVKGSPVSDLVIVKTATLVGIPGTVQIRQDGGGQGPPH
jgi:hypothetical protein